MRHPFSSHALARAPVVKALLIALVLIYILFELSVRLNWGAEFFYLCELNPAQVFQDGYVWQLFTYAFLHEVSNPMHLVFNCLLFFFIGPELEIRWGGKRFVFFTLAAILGGAIFVSLSFWLGLSDQPVIGFSAVCLGLIVAWGLSHREGIIYVFGMIPISGLALVFWTLGLEILYALSISHVSSAAHFGGMAVGAVLTMGWWRPNRLKKYMQKMTFTSHRDRWN